MAPQPIRSHDVPALAAALENVENLDQVRLAFFGRATARGNAKVHDVANEVALATRGRVWLDEFDVDDEPWSAERFGIRRTPCVAVLGPEGDTGIRFDGGLEGFGAASLTVALRLAAGADPGLAPRFRTQLGELAEPLRLLLFVDHWDARTPAVVRAVAAVVLASPLLRVDIVTAPDFPVLSRACGVAYLPALRVAGRTIPVVADAEVLTHTILTITSGDV